MKVVSGRSKPKAPAEHKGRRASHMTIERAENGLMVTTHHERPKGKSKQQEKAMMMDGMGYEPPEKKVFTGRKELMDHMNDKFGDVMPENDAKPADSAAKAGGSNHGADDTQEEEEEDEGA